MNTIGQVVGGLSPEAQVVLIFCLFVIVYALITDRRKMRTAERGASQVAKIIAQLRKKRKNQLPKEPPDQLIAQ